MNISHLIGFVIAVTLALHRPAHGQILPTDPLPGLEETILEPVERQVEDQVETAIEDRALTAPDSLLDRLDEIAPTGGLDAAAAVDDLTLQLAQTTNQIEGIVSGAVSLTAPVRRPIDVDASGDWPVLRDEWVALIDTAERDLIAGLDVEVVEETPLRSAELTLFTIRVRSDSPDAARVEDILEQLGADRVDRNYIYRGAQGAEPIVSSGPSGTLSTLVSSQRTGLIDTAIDHTHPALATLALSMEDFVTLEGSRPLAHGTSVASILSSHLGDGTQLLAASVFFLSEDGQTGASTASLVKALDWMLTNEVTVINISLTGPPDRTLEQMIALSLGRGAVIVAAVGNGGPAAPPLYPAAYDGVIGVTAVDREGILYRWANRGAYVDVAALGVGVDVAVPGGGWTRDSGTSLAAPVVSAVLAGTASDEPPNARLLARVALPASGNAPELYGAGIITAD